MLQRICVDKQTNARLNKQINDYFSVARQLPVSQGLFIIEVSQSYSDAPISVGTQSPPQHTTLTRDIHATGGIRAHNPIKRTAADRRLRQRGYWGRLNNEISG